VAIAGTRTHAQLIGTGELVWMEAGALRLDRRRRQRRARWEAADAALLEDQGSVETDAMLERENVASDAAG
jgi:hypothetical protein